MASVPHPVPPASPRFAAVADVFDALGGARVIGGIVRVSPKTASGWRDRNSIPVIYWPLLLASAQGVAIGLSSDDLMRACTQGGNSNADTGGDDAAAESAPPRDCATRNPESQNADCAPRNPESQNADCATRNPEGADVVSREAAE